MNLPAAREFPVRKSHLSWTISGPTFIYYTVVAVVLSLSIFIDVDVDGYP